MDEGGRMKAERRVGAIVVASIIALALLITSSSLLVITPFSHLEAADDAVGSKTDEPTAGSRATAIEFQSQSWPLARGNAVAAGVAKTTLPDKPELLWKVTIDKGAFEA